MIGGRMKRVSNGGSELEVCFDHSTRRELDGKQEVEVGLTCRPHGVLGIAPEVDAREYHTKHCSWRSNRTSSSPPILLLTIGNMIIHRNAPKNKYSRYRKV